MALRELAQRRDAGVSVRLLWDAQLDQVLLQYTDWRGTESWLVEVPNASALDAFNHPNLYRPLRAA